MNKENQKEVPNVERDGWKAEDVVEESVNKDSDDTVREIMRGDESKGDPDNRDVAGSPEYKDTPHGREESKNDKE